MLKQLTIILLVSSFASAACAKPQTEANNSNSGSNIVNSNQTTTSVSNQDAKSSNSQTTAKSFLGDLDSKRIQMNLTRDGNSLSGTYQYEKIGKELKLSGTIDAAGKFSLQETDAAGNKTGLWNGTWKETDGRATLTGKWKNPRGGKELDFSADELANDFTSGAKITTKTFNEENKVKFYEITAEYPELSGVNQSTAANFNQSAKKIVDDNLGEFKKNLSDYSTPEDLKRYRENKISLYDATTYDLEMANDDLISVMFTDANFLGGAHGSSATTTLNFDLKNNRVLNLADIFEPNSNYLKTLSDLSRADLKVKLEKDGVLDAEMLNPGTEPKEENFRAWNLTNKGLLITFDPYQVAAYVAGPQEVIIPYSKLQSILRKDGIVAKMAK